MNLKGFCCDQCEQEASLIRRVAKLLEGPGDEKSSWLRLWVFGSVCFVVKYASHFRVRFGTRRPPQPFSLAHLPSADKFSDYVADVTYNEHGQNKKKVSGGDNRSSLFRKAEQKGDLSNIHCTHEGNRSATDGS